MPKPLISAESIFDAALELLENDGAAALTARNLTERLHCSTKTLYHQVGTREQMVRGIVRHAFARMELGFEPGPDVPATIIAWATTLRRELLAHPALGSLMTVDDSGVVTDYAVLLMAALRRHGYDDRAVVTVAGIVSHVTVSMTLADIEAPGLLDDPEVFATALRWLTDGIVAAHQLS